MLMHLESQVSACNCAGEEMLLCTFLEAAEGFFVAAVIKVISDLCQELVDTTTAAASLWVQYRPETILRFESGSFMLKVSEGLSRK